VKRRFLLDGTEIAFSPVVEATGAGCDVEVAGITVHDDHWWTFAFAAFGQPATRRKALLASWRALVTAAPYPEPFEPRTARTMSYPEWLTIHGWGADGLSVGRSGVITAIRTGAVPMIGATATRTPWTPSRVTSRSAAVPALAR
jgi:hypothetical protein